MIKRGIVNEELTVDSHLRRENGSCPLMPEEVCLVLTCIFKLWTLYFLLSRLVFDYLDSADNSKM